VLIERLQLLDIYLVTSPPAPEGMMYFVGNKPGYFPYAKGPIYYLKGRPMDSPIPAVQIRAILHHLEVTEAEFATTDRPGDFAGLGSSLRPN
jgi:hypothetical protein